jgi:membrane-bound lytic murein transglycosylase B
MRHTIALLCLLLSPALSAQDFPQQYPEVEAFIAKMVSEHDFSRGELKTLFEKVEHQPRIIEAITRPAESKPWYQYRPIFVTEKRIRAGVAFWQENRQLLARAEETYGVPAHIIVAIIGVETFYGRHKGSYRVIDALSTLGFDYPPRAGFFRGQLEQFLLMSREEKRDPLTFQGSYAGAMGMPQFIPSSFRHYAVDFDGDGQRDLWDNRADIIGSVANYFARHRWQKGEPIASRADLNHGKAPQSLLDKGIRPSLPIARLKDAGVSPKTSFSDGTKGALLALESGPEEQEYWVTLDNFYVITRYNHSPLYAMAVYQLAEAIRTSRTSALRKAANSPG